MRRAGIVVALVLAWVAGCMSQASYPKIGLQRALYPGLGGLDAKGIEAALGKQLVLHPPLSAGIVWLDDRGSFAGDGLSDYARTGILQRAVEALQQPPFARVAPLPTTMELEVARGDAPSLDAVRSAAATFQYDVAFILQSGSERSSGVNAFAIGYVPLVTAPLFPGTDVSVAAGAELCAVDVRSGIMLGCGVGRARGEDRYLFPFSVDESEAALREEIVAQAVGIAATDVVAQVGQRLQR